MIYKYMFYIYMHIYVYKFVRANFTWDIQNIGIDLLHEDEINVDSAKWWSWYETWPARRSNN